MKIFLTLLLTTLSVNAFSNEYSGKLKVVCSSVNQVDADNNDKPLTIVAEKVMLDANGNLILVEKTDHETIFNTDLKNCTITAQPKAKTSLIPVNDF